MPEQPVLTQPPFLPVPAGITITDVPLAAHDPRVAELQLLENWIRIYRHRAQQLLEQIWSEGREGDQKALGEITCLTRMGVRKRAQPHYAAEINERRRKKNTEPKAPS